MPDLLPLFLAASYLLGAIPCGFLIVRLDNRRDIRTLGSGNIGATNVLRARGWAPALLTLLLDAAKGALPVLAGRLLFDPPALAFAGGLAAVCGHVFPVFLGFRGGKGVAPLLGVLLAFQPLALAAFAASFLLVTGACRYVSLGSLSGTAAALAVLGFSQPAEVTLPALAAGLLVAFRHRANIKRLWHGNEHRLSLGKKYG